MNRNEFHTACKKIENLRDKLGETFYDAIQEDDNTTYEMAKGILRVFNEKCSTEKELMIADAMLIAVCGYSILELVDRINERDKDDYHWYF